jgi:4-alpha-glucanotransferase
MSNDDRPLSLPPFPSDYRASGLLLDIMSLPSAYGIGDVGPSALEWIDRLQEAGQSWWQELPFSSADLHLPEFLAQYATDFGSHLLRQ